MPDKCQGRYLVVCDEKIVYMIKIFTSLAKKLETVAKQRFLALAERHMTKREGILFSE